MEQNAFEARFINTSLTYRYFDVPKEEFEGLMQSASEGTYMHNHILDFYDYEKVRGKRRRNG